MPVFFQVLKNDRNMLAVRFALNEDTYSGLYFLEVLEFLKDSPSSLGHWCKFQLRKSNRHLLFHLTLLLVIHNTTVFYLDNFTDDPARAAQGIYELLDVDKTIIAMGHRSEFAGLNLEDQHLSEGGMRLIIDRSTLQRWKAKMMKLAQNVQNRNLPSPWIQPVESGMQQFVAQISQLKDFLEGVKSGENGVFHKKLPKMAKSGKKSKKKQKRKSKFQFSKIKFP